MSNITFDKEAKSKNKKEDIEWLRIWCEDTNDRVLPRIALIGDSITEGYYPFVRDALKGVTKVDYLATSYSVASDIYRLTVENFVKDSKYEVIHYNYGLHAFSVSEEDYALHCRRTLERISTGTSVVVANTTTVLDESLQEENASWREKVIVRNEKLKTIANDLGFVLNDLNARCKTFDISMRNSDGVHFRDAGYIALAESVVQCIRRQLERG